jgi:hypothetical protein
LNIYPTSWIAGISRTHLKKDFSPDISVETLSQVLAILEYVCGFRRGFALISNENPNFEMASNETLAAAGRNVGRPCVLERGSSEVFALNAQRRKLTPGIPPNGVAPLLLYFEKIAFGGDEILQQLHLCMVVFFDGTAQT